MSRQTTLKFRGLNAEKRNGLRNPERGFRFEIGVGKIPADLVKFPNVRDHWPFDRYKDDGVTMSQAYCYLTQYTESDIPQEKLDALQADFDRARREGYKFLFRFAYEFNETSPGPTLERTLSHIEQLKDIVRRNSDVIYVLQTGWVGLWGEFHTSVHGINKDPEAVVKIMKATLDMLPDDRVTMMRCMRYKETVMNGLGGNREVTAGTAHTLAPEARIGFFNDGTLANYWDGGTFLDPPYAAPGNPEFDRVVRESPYIPVDGELFWNGEWTDLNYSHGLDAAKRLNLHHYSTLSLVHGFSELDQTPEKGAIDEWKKSRFTAELATQSGLPFDPAYFEGAPHRTAFEYIRDHLGYRLALKSADFTSELAAGEPFKASLLLENYGFAAPVNPRKPVFVFRKADGTVLEKNVGSDMRNWRTGEIGFDFSTDLPAGEYELAIAFPDARGTLANRPEYAIRLATEMPVREENGRLLHILGPVSVRA